MENHLTYLNSDTVEEVTSMMDGDAELIIDLIDTLMETAPELMEQLQNGLAQGDAVAVREAAHALKSSTAQMGAFAFSDLCKEMEEKGKNQDLAAARILLADMKADYTRTMEAMAAWKASL